MAPQVIGSAPRVELVGRLTALTVVGLPGIAGRRQGFTPT